MQVITSKTIRQINRGAKLAAHAVGLATLFSCSQASAAVAFKVFAADVAAPAPAMAAQQQQMRAQIEPLLKVELSFANRVCKLSNEQRRTMIAKSNAWLDEFLGELMKQDGRQPQVQGVVRWMARGNQQSVDPRESVQAGVAKLVKSDLPKEQAARYEEECRKRAEFQQQVAVENLVARVDAELKLSPEQRAKLTESLSMHWDKSWAPQIEIFVHGMEIWPNVPDQWIRPHLTAAQQLAWGRLNKHAGHMFFGGDLFGNGQVIDDIDLTEGRDQAAEADDNEPVAAANAAAN